MTDASIESYSRTDVATVGWDEELNAVVLRWHGFAASEYFREKMDLCIELLEELGANKMYADAREQGAISDEDKRWSVADWAGRAEAAGLEHLVIVYPESVVAKMAVDAVIEQVDDGIEREITDDLAGGRAWIANRPTTATDVTVPPGPGEEPTPTPGPAATEDGPDHAERTGETGGGTATNEADDRSVTPPVEADPVDSERDGAVDSTAGSRAGGSRPTRGRSATRGTSPIPVGGHVGGLVGLAALTVVLATGTQPHLALGGGPESIVAVVLASVAVGVVFGSLATAIGTSLVPTSG